MDLLLHIDEIFLKGANQPFFYRCLKNNLSQLFTNIKASRVEGGILIEDFNKEETGRLSFVPGIANFAEVLKCEHDLRKIKMAVDCLINNANAGSFRISAERSYKKFEFSSMEIEHQIGAYVQKKTGWKVNLKNPNLTIHISVSKKCVYVFVNKIEGAGGLPTGSSGKVLCLLSGGIDSPVAAYKMMVRGAEVGLIHFQNQTKVEEEVGQKIFDLAKKLAGFQPRIKLYIVPFAELQKQIIMKIPSQYRMIITRRLFFRIAELVAADNQYLALATGDSLGQVASQTLENLNVVYSASKMLKLAPLIGANKRDIMSLSKKINTMEISSRPYEDCCSLFVAKHPVTNAKLNDVLRLENNIDLAELDKVEKISYSISIV